MPDDSQQISAEWPPPTIVKWLARKAVVTDDLVQELDYWARHMAGDPSGPHYFPVDDHE